MKIEFLVACRDALTYESDVLVLKYAQARWGLDDDVARILVSNGVATDTQLSPARGFFAIVDSRRLLGAPHAMFLGTFPVQSFDYDEVSRFARRAIEGVAEADVNAKHIATTLHGIGFGLDAGECAQSLVVGFLEGLRAVHGSTVQRISIVDRNPRLIGIITRSLEQVGIGARVVGESEVQSRAAPITVKLGADAVTGEATSRSLTGKGHVFVAMPFAPEFEDVYEFGIYGPVRAAGLVCERVDQASFTGDILTKIKERIATAEFVIADLTGARPNVYLEVGYAWGKETPVVFLARNDESLHFDVKTQRCIIYSTIRQLARDLERLIAGLYPELAHRAQRQSAWIADVKRRFSLHGEWLRTRDGVVVLDLPLSLASGIPDSIIAGVDELDPGHLGGMIINLKDVDRMNSTGLGELIRLWGTLNKQGRRVAVVSPPAEAALMTKLIRPFDLFSTEEAALEAIKRVT